MGVALPPSNLSRRMPLPAPLLLRMSALPTTSIPDQDWFFDSGMLLSESNGRVERSLGMSSENGTKKSVTVIGELPGFVTERSVAQSPESAMIEPAPGIMIAWKLGGETLNLICTAFVPWLFVSSPVTVSVTVFAPADRKACV